MKRIDFQSCIPGRYMISPATLVCLLMFAFSFTNCHRETVQPEGPPVLAADATPPRLVDGRLVFQDSDHMNEVVQTLLNQDESVLIRYESALQFESLRAAYQAGEAQDMYMDGEEPIVHSLVLSSLLNPAGEIVIGEVLWDISADGVFRTENEGRREKMMDIDMSVTEIEDSGNDRGTIACPSAACLTGISPCIQQYNAAGRTYRLRGRFYTDNFFFYAEAGVLAKHERKNTFLFFTWWTNYAVHHVSVKSDVCVGMGTIIGASYPVPISGSPMSFSQTNYNNSGVHHVFYGSVVFNMKVCFWDVDGYFESATHPSSPWFSGPIHCTL